MKKSHDQLQLLEQETAELRQRIEEYAQREMLWRRIEQDLKEKQEEYQERDELELRVRERTAALQEAASKLAVEIEERKQAEKAVRERKAQYCGIFDAVSDGLLILDLNGAIVECNPEACIMHGYTYEELVARYVTDLVHPDYHNQGEYFSAQLKKKRDVQAESVHVRKDGTTLSVDSKAIQFDYRGTPHILCIFRDISVYKEADHALRLLSSKLLSVEEHEKARIARELHDSFGQTLTAVKFGIEHAVQQLENNSADSATKTLTAVTPLHQQGVEKIRKMSMKLRPTMLDTLGIVSTTKWFMQEFKKVHPHIRTRVEAPVREEAVRKPLKLTLYRILQEATNNIAKQKLLLNDF